MLSIRILAFMQILVVYHSCDCRSNETISGNTESLKKVCIHRDSCGVFIAFYDTINFILDKGGMGLRFIPGHKRDVP